MKEIYTSPKMDVEVFSLVDVLTSSDVEETTTKNYIPSQTIEYLDGEDD